MQQTYEEADIFISNGVLRMCVSGSQGEGTAGRSYWGWKSTDQKGQGEEQEVKFSFENVIMIPNSLKDIRMKTKTNTDSNTTRMTKMIHEVIKM